MFSHNGFSVPIQTRSIPTLQIFHGFTSSARALSKKRVDYLKMTLKNVICSLLPTGDSPNESRYEPPAGSIKVSICGCVLI